MFAQREMEASVQQAGSDPSCLCGRLWLLGEPNDVELGNVQEAPAAAEGVRDPEHFVLRCNVRDMTAVDEVPVVERLDLVALGEVGCRKDSGVFKVWREHVCRGVHTCRVPGRGCLLVSGR